MKYRGPCIDCGAFKDQQYSLKRCIACYQKYHRYNKEFKPRKRYDGPCVHCGTIERSSGRFVRKMCGRCYSRFKETGDPRLKDRIQYRGPCIVCGTMNPGYTECFQKEMCSKCYRHHVYVQTRPEIEPRYCIDCRKELSPRGKLERCLNCNNKYRWHNDPEYRKKHQKRSKRYTQTKNGHKKIQAHVRHRRAKLAQVENTLTNKEWDAVLEAFNHRCAYCGSKGPLEMDHVTPISKDGPHVMYNVVPACRSCNASKRDGVPPAPVQTLML